MMSEQRSVGCGYDASGDHRVYDEGGNDQQLSRMREFNAELDRLMREQFYSIKSPEAFLVEATKAGSRALRVQRVSVWTYSEDRETIICQCLYDGGHRPEARGTSLNSADFPNYFMAMSQARFLSAPHAQTCSSTSEFTETYLKPLNIESLLDAQIPSATAVRGVLCCESVGQVRNWGVDEQSFAASLAELVGQAFDRAEHEQTQAQLAAALRAAEKAAEAKSAFLANMSHEIRTPMNGILGTLELVLHNEQDLAKREMLGLAYSSAKSLLTVLDDVLDYSRLEAGQVSLVSEPYEPGKIATEVTRLFRSNAEEKGLALKVNIDPATPGCLLGDASRVRQVLSNLVANAVKFTDQGGVDVSLSGQPGTPEPMLRFEVRDTGIGIAPDSLPRLFQRFSQLDASSTRRFGGAGLGLVICKQLVDSMGGEIGVESQPNVSTCFWFTLPQRLPDSDEIKASLLTEPTAVPDLTPKRGLKVLAAEDNQVNRGVLKAMLSSLGHQVTLVENGDEVLSTLSSECFDLILMDIQMPVKDGLKTTREIRDGTGDHRSIPIVALTANAMTGDRDRYLEAGMDDYLAKPVTRDQLVALFERLSL